jgi:hypothetical protein
MRRTRDLPPVLRRALWTVLTLAVGLLGAVRPAHAEELFADLDRDGIRDVIVHTGSGDSVVQVWLSRTTSTRALRTRLPLVWVRVVDLDGDGRLDLIGADKASRVHVWRYRRGRLRPVHAVPPRSRTRSRSTGTLGNDPGAEDIALPGSGTASPPCDAPGVPSRASLLALSSVSPASLGEPTSCAVVLPPSRAPPVSH